MTMRKRILKIYICLALVAVAYFAWCFITGLSIPCYYLSVHGYECPGCGLSRMIFSLMKLQFGKAFLYNPVGFVSFFVWIGISAVYWWRNVEPVKKPVFIYIMFTLTMTAFLIQGFFRNFY